jgi:hypothetical protein
MHASNPSIWEVEAGKSRVLRTACSKLGVQSKPGLNNERLNE